MSVKSRLLAAAATLTLVGGVGVTGLLTGGTAHAATPSCGDGCIDLFNQQFTSGNSHPGFLVDSYKQGIGTGNPIILFRESNSDPAEDFTISNQGTVADFFTAGLVNAQTALHYGCIAAGNPGSNFHDCVFGQFHPNGNGDANLTAVEFEYAPFGAPTGQCIGVAATPTSGEKVTLQACGVSARTVWIIDAFDGQLGDAKFPGVPLINGANTNFSHPFVLTYPSSGFPTDQPRPVLNVANLSGHFVGIFANATAANQDVNSNQLWQAVFGPIHS